MYKQTFLPAFLGLICLYPLALTAEEVNAGFVQGIWLSDSQPIAGNTITLYTAVQNQSNTTLNGTVTFTSNGVEIGYTDFSILPNNLKRVSLPLQVTYGEQSFNALITIGGEVSLLSPTMQAHDVFIDNDTDNDSIADREDEDDDNDGLSDKEEEKLGTNPKLADTDGDGMSDGEEVAAQLDPNDPEDARSYATKDIDVSKLLPLLSSIARSAQNALKKTVQTISPLAETVAEKAETTIYNLIEETPPPSETEDVSLHTEEDITRDGSTLSQFMATPWAASKTIDTLRDIFTSKTALWYHKAVGVILAVAAFLIRSWIWTGLLLLIIWGYIKMRRRSQTR